MKFSVPYDMDKECIKLCTKLNELGDLQTTESCCGHLVNQYVVFFECHDFARLAKLYRCVDRNYSDGKWEVTVDGSDTTPVYQFCLRSIKPFASYDEMDESVNRLISNIDYWEDHSYDTYFATDDSLIIIDGCLVETDTKTVITVEDGDEVETVLRYGETYDISFGNEVKGRFVYVGKVNERTRLFPSTANKNGYVFRKPNESEITFTFFGDRTPYTIKPVII